MKLGAKAAIIGRTKERLNASAKELNEKTGKECLPIQADVRKYVDLEEAAKQTVDKFGRIDYVVCGMPFIESVWPLSNRRRCYQVRLVTFSRQFHRFHQTHFEL
jgi:short-subunit dehydrogenase